jgi:hypothetical protein
MTIRHLLRRGQVAVRFATAPLLLAAMPPRLAGRLGSSTNLEVHRQDVQWILSILLAAGDTATAAV